MYAAFMGSITLNAAEKTPPAPIGPQVALPMERTAYFVGETIPLGVTGLADGAEFVLDGAGKQDKVRFYRGKDRALLLRTAAFAPGVYQLHINGKASRTVLHIISPLRRSAGSMQDESMPSAKPNMSREERNDPVVRARKMREYKDGINATLRASGLTGCVNMGAAEMQRHPMLDTLARTGTIMLVNPDTRPSSFCPVSVDPVEIDGMSQRMILTAQANGRYPNFGGFCIGWDTTGFQRYGRKMFLVYWAWGKQTENLRDYINKGQEKIDAHFRRLTGMEPVTDEEYIAYLLSIGRPDLAPFIDMPTRDWMREIARKMKPLPQARLIELEKRNDAYARYLMGLYDHAYSRYMKNLKSLDPSLHHTSSVQVDHCPVRYGQYLPDAYKSLDFMYQTTWNDQVGGPDYAYQWLFTQGLLNMNRRGRPIWISNAFGGAHGRSGVPGKFVRVAAHGLAYGASGIGFALEGFSNLLGGMNRNSRWEHIKNTPDGSGVLAGKEFLDRFACLAVEGRGDHGAGVLFSKSQFSRQTITLGFGSPRFRAFVALARLGYTPRYVTEEELAASPPRDIKALVVVTQSAPLPKQVLAGIDAFVKAGGGVFVDKSTSVRLPGARTLDLSVPFAVLGKPHNMSSPNLPTGDNDALMWGRIYKEMGRPLSEALGATGRGAFTSGRGCESEITLLQIDGGRDATYVAAVNDSFVKSQADWVQVTEELTPYPKSAKGQLYDCTEEKDLGVLKPVTCDLTKQTARVYAVLKRAPTKIDLKAQQTVIACETLNVAVQFLDAKGQRIEALIPFALSLMRPDRTVAREFYRSTTRSGEFSMALPTAINAPAGVWRLTVRCQLNGAITTLPVTVKSVKEPRQPASPMTGRVFCRGPAAPIASLPKGREVILPLFEGQKDLLPAARKVKELLGKKGITVRIEQAPELGVYWLVYRLTDQQRKDNERVAQGQVIGRIKRTTVNRNDWYSGMSGYRAARALILLDIAGKADNEMSERLDDAGLLWPRVSDAFPGKGKAVVQVVRWAFGPRLPAIVIQARDAEGILAGAASLTKTPADPVSPGAAQVRKTLWREFHIGGKPVHPRVKGLTARGIKHGTKRRPFVFDLRGATPPRRQDIAAPQKPVPPATTAPGLIDSNSYIPYDCVDGKYVETSTARSLLRDLNFSKAVKLVVEVKQSGSVTIAGDGVFRNSDKDPLNRAQWEGVLKVRKKYITPEFKPMRIEVRLGGKVIGEFLPTRREIRDVPIESLPWYAREKPKSVREEVVVELTARLALPAGRQELMLIPHNIVDGCLNRVRVGISRQQADAIEDARKKSKKK